MLPTVGGGVGGAIAWACIQLAQPYDAPVAGLIVTVRCPDRTITSATCCDGSPGTISGPPVGAAVWGMFWVSSGPSPSKIV